MKKIYFFITFAILSLFTSLQAQTIIDLKKGGGVRAKTIDDYNTRTIQDRALRQDSMQFQEQVTLAFNALAADSLNKANSLFREAIKRMPRNQSVPLLHHQLGLISLAQNNPIEAIQQFTETLKSLPDFTESRLRRAYAYLDINNSKDARSDCNILLNTLPTDTTIIFLSSVINTQQRLYANARLELEELCNTNPSNINYWISLGIVNQRDNRPNEAIEKLNHAVMLEPNNPDALAARAEVEAGQNKLYLARADLDKAISLANNRSDLHIQRATILIKIKEKAAARDDLNKAIKMGVPRSSIFHLLELSK